MIVTHPEAVLRQKAELVRGFDDNLMRLLQEMQQLMEQGPGGVGIAAPQLGESLQVMAVDCTLAQRKCKNHGRLLMMNPEIIEQSGEVLGREGCLSVPDWVAMVPRAKHITVRYQDEYGEQKTLQSSAFEARVIQHELDHLHGILFIDRVLSMHDLVRRM